MEDLLQQGITAYKAGKRDEARRIFLTVVKQNIDSERAWGWMNNVCKTDQERIHCLKQVLRINPKNEKARQMLDQLLVPTFASDLPLSAVSSVQLSLSPSGAKATSRNSSFTQTQLLILIRLTITVFLIIGFAILYRVGPKNAVVIGPYPTSSVTSSAKLFSTPTEVLSTATLISNLCLSTNLDTTSLAHFFCGSDSYTSHVKTSPGTGQPCSCQSSIIESSF